MTNSRLKTYALCSSALAALAVGSTAHAQGAGGTADEVVVTGSRVITNGFSAPTPVTVVTMEQMQQTAPNSLSDAINQLPQFKSSFMAQSSGFLAGAGSGSSYLNLRGLGIVRNLTLLDGQRVVAGGENGTSAGAVDLNAFPQNLVKRVDVVTGGASAQYGSDALTGVVNFVLDTKFTGIKGEVRGGLTTYGDNKTFSASIAIGHDFAGGRGHVIAATEYYQTRGISNYLDRPWANHATSFITNPNCPVPQTSLACPTRILVDNTMPANQSTGGLIITGPNALRGQYFSSTAGALTPFPFGNYRSATTMAGGGLDSDRNLGAAFSSLPPQKRGNAYLRAGYDLTPNWNVYASAMYADSKSHFDGILGNAGLTNTFTIFDDNVYLPTAVRNQMLTTNPVTGLANAGATSLALINPVTGQLTGPTRNTITIGRLDTDWPASHNYAEVSMLRGVLGIDGKADVLGTTWTVSSYYSHSESLKKSGATGNQHMVNLYRSIDAVASPGGAGLPAAGSPVCRSTITNPTDGCVPLNVLGPVGISSAAWSYITGGPANGNSQLTQRSTQDVAEFNARADLFTLPAGPVSAGFGASYRREEAHGVADTVSESYLPAIPGQPGYIAGLTPVLNFNGLPAGSRGARTGWDVINSGGYKGSLNVKEVYGEALIPLLRDSPLAKSWDLNGAVRYADYQYGGGQLNWKVGMVYQPVDDLRIRATQSHDIRAPNLANLFAGVSATNGVVSDPFRRGVTGVIENNTGVVTYARGNPLLKPEIGDTFTMGIVYRPTFNKWVDGFSASIDYYAIIVTDAIASTSAVTQCSLGNTYYCQFITRQTDPASFGAGNTIGPITQVFNVPQNIGTTKNNGLDIEVSYRLPLSKIWDGRTDVLTFRALFNDMLKNQAFTLGSVSQSNSVGIIGGGVVAGTGGNSDWSGTVSANYQRGPLTINWQERFINSGRIQATVDELGNPIPATSFTNPNPTGNGAVPNVVGKYFYSDLSISYKFGADNRFETFLTINNLFDKDPPQRLGSGLTFYGVYPTNYTLYDTIGRNFQGGVRFRF